MSKPRQPSRATPALPVGAGVRPTLWPAAADKPADDDFDIDVLEELSETLNNLLNISDTARRRLTQEASLVPMPAMAYTQEPASLAASFQVAVDHARTASLPVRLLNAIEKWRAENPSREERLYVITQMQGEDADLLARVGLLDPFDVFEAAAFDGVLPRMLSLYHELGLGGLPGWQDCLDRALTSAAIACDILDGHMTSVPSHEAARQLLQWGASPHADGTLWRDVLAERDGDIIGAFLDHGADIVPVLNCLGNLSLDHDFFGKRYFGKLDDQTLLEITFMPPVSSRAVFSFDSYLRTIYAFDRGRVIEIIQTDSDAGTPSSVITQDLSALPASVIRDRHARLCALGGTPPLLGDMAVNSNKMMELRKPRQ